MCVFARERIRTREKERIDRFLWNKITFRVC